jgi:hypothetical protein
MTDFWDVPPRSQVEIDRRFGGVYCFHHPGDKSSSSSSLFIAWMMEAVSTSEKSVSFYQTALSNVTEDAIFTIAPVKSRQILHDTRLFLTLFKNTSSSVCNT